MRKVAAIFLQCILLFNIAGYRAWFYYAERNADIKMEASLDNNEYNEADLVTLRVPLNMPYQIDNARFERVNGEFSFEGKIYKYVKRRVSNGTLVLLCLPDVQKMHLRKAKTEYGNYANDISSSSNKNTGRSDLQKNHSCSEYEAFLFRFS
ncbi:MAG: hypothetical protein Q8939_17550, partial [Bacteroidota bacterium]|nr:hypothetical protein [Bacteroidota bacterium]